MIYLFVFFVVHSLKTEVSAEYDGIRFWMRSSVFGRALFRSLAPAPEYHRRGRKERGRRRCSERISAVLVVIFGHNNFS